MLEEVAAERAAQDAKWGQQNHPDGTGPLAYTPATADDARRICDREHAAGRGTFAQILAEEFAEAIEEPTPPLLRIELIQVAAVAVAWVEAIDRRSAQDMEGT